MSQEFYLWDPKEEKYNPEMSFNEQMDPKTLKILEIGENGKIENLAARKRFLIFALKNSRYLTIEDAGSISKLTGTDTRWVNECIYKLRDSISDKEIRLKKLVKKRNKAFYRIFGFYTNFFIYIYCIIYKCNQVI